MPKGGKYKIECYPLAERELCIHLLADRVAFDRIRERLLEAGIAEDDLPSDEGFRGYRDKCGEYAMVEMCLRHRIRREKGLDLPRVPEAEAEPLREQREGQVLDAMMADGLARLDRLRTQQDVAGDAAFLALTRSLQGTVRTSVYRRRSAARTALEEARETRQRAQAQADPAVAAQFAVQGVAGADAADPRERLTEAAIRALVEQQIGYDPPAEFVTDAIAAYTDLAAELAARGVALTRRREAPRLERPLDLVEAAALSCFSCRRAAARLLGVEADTTWLCRDQSAYLDVLVGLHPPLSPYATRTEADAVRAGAPFVQLPLDPLTNGPNLRPLRPGLTLLPPGDAATDDAATTDAEITAADDAEISPFSYLGTGEYGVGPGGTDTRAWGLVPRAPAPDHPLPFRPLAQRGAPARPWRRLGRGPDRPGAPDPQALLGMAYYLRETRPPYTRAMALVGTVPTPDPATIQAAAAAHGLDHALLLEAYAVEPGDAARAALPPISLAHHPLVHAPGAAPILTWGCPICEAHAVRLQPDCPFHGAPGRLVLPWHPNGPVYDARGWVPVLDASGPWRFTGLLAFAQLHHYHAAARRAGLPCGPSVAQLEETGE